MSFPHLSTLDTSSLEGMAHLGVFISSMQKKSGAIPSNKNGSHDPWDHLEAVMGLATLGYMAEALNVFTQSPTSKLEVLLTSTFKSIARERGEDESDISVC